MNAAALVAHESDCPAESLLLELSQGAIEGAKFESLLAHLDGCTACRRIVAELARDALPPMAHEACEPGPRPGDSIDRFLLLDELGRGGMGVVYAAFDPTLDRKVALKLVRPDPSLPARAAAARLLAEAQTLGKLSHPNVVTVFEARAHGEQVYLAMELIAGRSLRELCESKPGVGVLLSRFCEAGRGLQAAHDAGLVHRDFKPDNALLGDDGRVCVTDFGLAQPGSPTRPARAEPAGTPGYIAPELWLGKPADARSDQFSFCVALWEALFGARPFSAERGAFLLEQVRRGPSAPLRATIPLRVRRALLRGLRFEPYERYESMRALLAELGDAPGQGRGLQAGRFSSPLLAAFALALLGTGATAHALWLDARASASPRPVAQVSSSPSLSASPTSLEMESLASISPASQESESDAESYARESFSPSERSGPSLERAPEMTALALATPLAHRRVPRGIRATSPAAPRRSRPAAAPASAPSNHALAEISHGDGRDGGSAPQSPGGGGSSCGEPKGASTLAPESDQILNTRTLR